MWGEATRKWSRSAAKSPRDRPTRRPDLTQHDSSSARSSARRSSRLAGGGPRRPGSAADASPPPAPTRARLASVCRCATDPPARPSAAAGGSVQPGPPAAERPQKVPGDVGTYRCVTACEPVACVYCIYRPGRRTCLRCAHLAGCTVRPFSRKRNAMHSHVLAPAGQPAITTLMQHKAGRPSRARQHACVTMASKGCVFCCTNACLRPNRTR